MMSNFPPHEANLLSKRFSKMTPQTTRAIAFSSVALAAFALLATLIGIAYGVGKDTNEGAIKILSLEKENLEKTQTVLRAENVSLRLQLENARPQLPPGSTSGESSPNVNTGGPYTGGAGSPSKNPLGGSGSNYVELTLRSGSTEIAFDRAVIASLIGTTFEGSPLRHKVTMTIGINGKDSKSFEKVDVGFTTVFNGYQIRILSSGTDIATLSVSKSEAK